MPIVLHEQLKREHREEPLYHRFAVTVAFPTHAGNHAERHHIIALRARLGLIPVIRVANQGGA